MAKGLDIATDFQVFFQPKIYPVIQIAGCPAKIDRYSVRFLMVQRLNHTFSGCHFRTPFAS
jgi:hypothetical protein